MPLTHDIEVVQNSKCLTILGFYHLKISEVQVLTLAPLQPPLPEHRERFLHPVHRLQRNFHGPRLSSQPKIRLNNPHRVHQHTPPNGHRRRLAHPRHVHAVLDGAGRVQRQPLLGLVLPRHPGRADQQDLSAGVGQRPGQLREPQVVAGHQPEPHSPVLEHHGIRGRARGLMNVDSPKPCASKRWIFR